MGAFAPAPLLRVYTALLASAAWALQAAGADCPQGCPARCPDQVASQSAWVRENFSLQEFWGTYYELQYHDNTQPRFMSCQRSVKSPNPDQKTYKDLFSLHVFGNATAVCDLEFNLTANPGVFLGHWRGSFRPDLTNINNTVIDVGRSTNGSFEWTLEFQCADNVTEAAKAGTPSGVIFAAINFYHRLPLVPLGTLQIMEERARARGVGWLLDAAPGLTRVDQRTCVEHHTYPPHNASTSMCGQQSRHIVAGAASG